MNCHICRTDSGHHRPAEAVCRVCGAAVCDTHVRVGRRELTQARGMGTSSVRVVTAMHCARCGG
ncbi:hypothetical protein [Streptomyces sp. NPDC057939]|uniref:hypothetical protein n=1 Tax=Streptomyces sp. NPDC057939 TaxID=3346284 RepID=UPI0036EBA8AF